MSEHAINGFMGISMEKIRSVVDANTMIGDPIHCVTARLSFRFPRFLWALPPEVPTCRPEPQRNISQAAQVRA